MKAILKPIVHVVCLILVSPLLLIYFAMKPLVGASRAIESASQTLAGVPGLTGLFLRRAFMSVALKRCASGVEIGYGTLFSQPGSILDSHVYIGPRCHLGLVHLEKDVLLAAGVHVPSGGQTHYFDDPDVPIREQGGARAMVTIGEGAWIGSAAIILADVGRGTIVGAGSVVTKPLPEFVVAAGVPAKVIRPRFPSGDTTIASS